jgi:hypothetical protein
MSSARPLAVLALLVLVAGCLAQPSSKETPGATVQPATMDGVTLVHVSDVMTFTRSVVTPAVAVTNDLYEPTMEVSDAGTIYVAAHVIGAATTGTPAWYSNDHGKTWAQLPMLASVSSPLPTGGQPPPGDEGFIVAGAKGTAWMADIYAYGFSITGWCDNGKSQCYDDRQAYDRIQSTTTPCDNTTFGTPTTAASLNDRPWAAYGNGSLLLINNPGAGPMQIGMLKVPPALPVGLVGANGPTWNLCASPGGDIPGIPSMRSDGLFAVPQMFGSGASQVLHLTLGHASDITKTKTVTVFPVTSVGSGTVNGGRTAFDKEGTLYVGARNNTQLAPAKDGNPITGTGGAPPTVKDGRFILAVSTDGGETFHNATFSVGSAVQSLYLDGNMNGPGALLTWSQVSSADKTKADWYVAHVRPGPDGAPVLTNVTLAVPAGPPFAAHVMGAAAGPDGSAYFVLFDQAQDTAGGTPISVVMQKDGARLPVDAPASG